MIRWYADDAELNSPYYSEISDIQIFGGIVIRQEDERGLCSNFDKLKYKISPDFHFPIKWNFRPLRPFFEKHDRIELYKKILDQSKEIREDIFTLISSSRITATIWLHIQKHRKESVEVIIDWPTGDNPKPFTEEYYCAYHNGKSAEYEQDYYCGKLSDLGFYEGLRFSKMTFCPLLQISDLIVGATRNLVDVAIGKNNDTFGLDMLKIVKDNF